MTTAQDVNRRRLKSIRAMEFGLTHAWFPLGDGIHIPLYLPPGVTLHSTVWVAQGRDYPLPNHSAIILDSDQGREAIIIAISKGDMSWTLTAGETERKVIGRVLRPVLTSCVLLDRCGARRGTLLCPLLSQVYLVRLKQKGEVAPDGKVWGLFFDQGFVSREIYDEGEGQ